MEQKQFTSGFVKVNPNSKIPAMYDYGVDESEAIRVFESGSIKHTAIHAYNKNKSDFFN